VSEYTVSFTCTVPDRRAADLVAAALAARGHALVAVRAYGHFTKDPTSWWYGKPLMQPELDGWWQVFSLDGRAYPDGPGGEQIERADARAVAAVAREHGGFADGGMSGHLETLRGVFDTVGLVYRGEPGPPPADAPTVIAPTQGPPLSVVEAGPAQPDR
jgi:hypothetical protein